MAANKKKATARHTEDTPVKSFLDMIAPSVVQFNPDHFICGNTFRCVWALREYPTQTDEQALLRHLGEKDGINYHFMTVADFEDHLAHDQIVEHTKYCENYYGTLRSEIEGRMALGIPVILVIEVEGAGNIKKMYPGATTIFVLPPDMEELERRLRNRGTENEETIQRRLKRAETEIANSVNYDEHVVNVEVDSCAESIYSIIQFKLKHGAAE